MNEVKTIDGNEAVAHVAYQLSEVIAIYPITPSSPIGEWADSWANGGRKNIWGSIPSIMEMQSEGGAAGAVHGALQAGSLATTFTASQGLLLMLPNMYKIAGELTPTVFHVASRSLAAQALSIFGDHSDVMATRATGFALLSSASVQEAMDFALISQAASLVTRIPFLHFFDGFRTSHELNKTQMLSSQTLKAMIDDDWINAHRQRALSPEHPVIRGTAQNPDVYFQARETVNAYYQTCPEMVQSQMNRFAELTGRPYQLYEYHGAPNADRVIVLMGSGCETVHETVDYLNQQGERVGVVKVRLYRPFDSKRLIQAFPNTVQTVAVLDRTKEPGSAGEPLYLDTVVAFQENSRSSKIIGGRYGLSSKEFTPAMVKAIFDNLASPSPQNHFTIGIHDDLTHTSLDYDPTWSIEADDVYRALFYGLGSDGTVGANKNAIKIIGKNTDYYTQAYFVYDSKKAGAMTISHLRFGPRPIRSPYQISKANFIGCHQSLFLSRYDILQNATEGGFFLLNTPINQEKAWEQLPREYQEHIIDKKLRIFIIDAAKIARKHGLGPRINTIMQVCFFAISNILPREQAIASIRASVEETYGKKGAAIVETNLAAVSETLEALHEIEVPLNVNSQWEIPPAVPNHAPQFVQKVTATLIAGSGDNLPVSALPHDGTYPTGTTQWEKRNLAYQIPVWDTQVCIQCGKCAMVCPHAVIRIKAYTPEILENAPATFKSCDVRDREWQDLKYTIQVAPEDCTGCAVCVDVCPAKNKSKTKLKAINMQDQAPLKEQEKENWEFFLRIPELARSRIKASSIRQQQVQQPLFEFSGACAGCGETPYLKLLSQLFGDRALIANATGCSSIYGGNLPTTPWSTNSEGRGPAWANSLFEDNAEFGLGIRLAVDQQERFAQERLKELRSEIGESLVTAILDTEQEDEAEIDAQRQRVMELKTILKTISDPRAKQLLNVADTLAKKSVWIVGGDGWAYDIGFGGLDHVLASGKNVNILVMDTEVYSNTGGQKSKATPRAAVAKFASGGKPNGKKDLGLIAMSYGHVYVAQVAMGAKDEHTLKAFLEAEAYQGPSLIIAYSQCIAHGINMTTGMQNQKAAVNTGQWLLYRHHPERSLKGENPLKLDSRTPHQPLREYMQMENRFKMLSHTTPAEAKQLLAKAEADIKRRWETYTHLANRSQNPPQGGS